MPQDRHIHQDFLRNMIWVTILCVGGVGACWVATTWFAYQNQVTQIRMEYRADIERRVRGEVEKALEQVRYARNNMQQQLEAELKSNVDQMHSVATGLYTSAHGSTADDTIKRQIIEALRPVRFFEERGYYFITGLDGISHLWPTHPELEGTHSLEQRDSQGRQFVQDLILLTQKEGGGFCRYTMARPDRPGGGHQKLAYVRHFAPYDWYIGTGEYLEDWRDATQEEVLRRLSAVHTEHASYLFASRYDGKVLMGPGKGHNILEDGPPHAQRVVRSLISQAKKGPGFVEYIMPPVDGQRQVPKISYVSPVEGWDWYIGAGISLEAIEDALAERQDELRADLLFNGLLLGGMLLALILLSLITARRLAARTERAVSLLSGELEKAINDQDLMNPDDLPFVEFRGFAKATNQLLLAHRQSEKQVRDAEEMLRHSQKMDAIGQLAGGVAHDFNNMLAGIMGAAEMLHRQIPTDPKAERYHAMIMTSATRAAELTTKLLAFARRQPLSMIAIDLNEIIREAASLLERTVDRRVEIFLDLQDGPAVVLGDPAQLQNVFMNLGINAAHAMRDGGRLSIQSRTVELGEENHGPGMDSLPAGRYIEIRVTDTGTGISPDVLPRIFEPFFTTKHQGQGSGLGLAVILGTIHSHGGQISVARTSEEGTVFLILLPRSEQTLDNARREDAPVTGEGNILFIDDEDVVRSTTEPLLTSLGYTVTAAPSGQAGLEVFAANPDAFDLVLLDMMMPDMSGRECFAKLRALCPDVPVLLASGFVTQEDRAAMEEQGLRHFIAKPFSQTALSQAVHTAIRESRAP